MAEARRCGCRRCFGGKGGWLAAAHVLFAEIWNRVEAAGRLAVSHVAGVDRRGQSRPAHGSGKWTNCCNRRRRICRASKLSSGDWRIFTTPSTRKRKKSPSCATIYPNTWIHGFESMPVETKLACEVRPLESAVGVLDTELRAAGLTGKMPVPLAPLLAKAREQLALQRAHVWIRQQKDGRLAVWRRLAKSTR